LVFSTNKTKVKLIFVIRLLLEAGAPVDEDFFPNCLSSVATASLYGYLSILHQVIPICFKMEVEP
jgi:hypothetical protein